MAGGLVGLLDDVAALAKLTAKASSKAAGVVIDDTAVTPAYLHGLNANRELPIIKKIATGSIRNKLLFIVPVALILSEVWPTLIEIILMFGGAYLCFEGAEKLYEKVSKHQKSERELPAAAVGPEHEDKLVKSAVTTDFILSAEIMVISLKSVIDQNFWWRAIIMIGVAILITAIVYGLVALIVKMDDVGLRLAEDEGNARQQLGQFLVDAMPKLLKWLSIIGTAAMLWVGGHILLVGTHELGWDGIYGPVHDIEEQIADGIGGFPGAALAWVFNTLVSAVIGIIVGGIIFGVLHRFHGGAHRKHPEDEVVAA